MMITRTFFLAWLCCSTFPAAAKEGVEQQKDAKILQYERAAAQGNVDAMFQLGFLYGTGRGVTQDYATARGWFEKAAAGGDASAMDNLGILYVNGLGVTQDYAAARSWFEKAIAKGNVAAMASLGTLYLNGQGAARDYNLAKTWYEKGAAGGDADAMRDLGILFDDGLGVAQNYPAARGWYEKAAAGGNTRAMRYLGNLYVRGHGVAQDYAAAWSWFEKAAAGGDTVAMLEVGTLYAKGQGVTQDYATARGWFEKAAAGGNATAMVNLGILYANGQGIAQDYAAARSWYKKAAAAGHAATPANRGVKSPCAPTTDAKRNLRRSPACTIEQLIKYQSALIISLTIESGNLNCSGEIFTPAGIVATANHCLTAGSAVQVLVGGNDVRPAEIISQNLKTDIALLRIHAEPGEYMRLPTYHMNNEDYSGDEYFSYAYPLGVSAPVKLVGQAFGWTETGSLTPADTDIIPGIDYDLPAIKIYSFTQQGVGGALFFDVTTQLPLGMAILSNKIKGVTLLVPWSSVEHDLNSLKQ